MSTVPLDNLVYALGFDVKKIKYPLDATGGNPFNQGDMLAFNSGSGYVIAAAAGASVKFVGIALKTWDLSLFVNQNTQAAVTNPELQALVGVNGVFSLKTTVGETYTEGVALYIGADAQTITTVSTTNTQVGVVKMRPNQTSVTGAAGVSIDVLITAQWPLASF